MTLREILKEKNISQSVVAEALGINVNNIRRYDSLEKRSLEELKIIAGAIDTTLSELIYLVGKNTPYKTNDPEDCLLSESELQFSGMMENIEDINPEKKEYIILQAIYNLTKAVLLNAENGKTANTNMEKLINRIKSGEK